MIHRKILALGCAFLLSLFLSINLGGANNPQAQTNVNQAGHVVDESGVPRLEITDVGIVEHPAWTALYALAYAGIEDYDPTLGIVPDPVRFEASIAWLKAKLKKNKDGLWVWLYHFDNTYNDITIKAPWSSAFAQATGIQALLAHWRITHDQTSLELAEKAAQSLFVPLQQGGFLFQRDEDVFFEEIPVPNENPSHILNGHMRVLLALDELKTATEKPLYAEWFNKGMDTLWSWLPLYDAGYWLRYDLNPRKEELLFRLANPYGFANPELVVDRIVLRDPISGEEAVLDVGAADDAEGALRIAGNDWGQSEQLDGRSVRRLRSVSGQREPFDSEGQMLAPHSYFYLKLPMQWQDNLRRERLELVVEYLDETPGNLQVQVRSIAPGSATFRELKDGDLLLSGSGQWRQWRVPILNSDLGFWVGKLYARKHTEYLQKLAQTDNRLLPWAQAATAYLNDVGSGDGFQSVMPEKMELPQQTPTLPIYSVDENGVLMVHLPSSDSRFDGRGMYDFSSGKGTPVYSPYIISNQSDIADGLAPINWYPHAPVANIEKYAAVEWLKRPENQIILDDAITYQFNFKNAYNDVVTQAPWVSAFSQAYIVRLLNGFRYDAEIKQLVGRIIYAYGVPLSQNGLSSVDKSGMIYFEEVPNATHVLNAHLISVAELTAIAEFSEDQRIRSLSAAGVETLRDKLWKFDSGYWMRYDLNPRKELLFQLDWLTGNASPLIEKISFEAPQFFKKIDLELGDEGVFDGDVRISGTEWLPVQQMDGKRVRAFSNGYQVNTQSVQGGARHNVYALMQLPEKTFSDYFDVYPHRLVIQYKDVAEGQFAVKIQSVNEGDVLDFIPLRNAVITTVGDQQWKQAVIEVRPQDMGWYKGADYQVYEVEQLQRIAKLSGDWFFDQYAERQGYFLQAKNNGKSVIVQPSFDVSMSENSPNMLDREIHLSVLASSPTYTEFGFENALDDDPDNDYVAGIENEFAYVDLKLDRTITNGSLRLVWENPENHAGRVKIHVLSGGRDIIAEIKDVAVGTGDETNIDLQMPDGFDSIRIEFFEFSGQPRILLRLIQLVSRSPSAVFDEQHDDGGLSSDEFMDANDPGNPLNIFRLPITMSIYDLSSQLAGNVQGEHQKILAFMRYIDGFSLGFPSVPTPDVIVKEKVGLCGNFTVLLLALARSQGMEGRIVNLYNYPENMGHTVAEIKFGDKWHLYDPTYNAFYALEADGEALSFLEIKNAYQAGVNVVEYIGSAREGGDGFTGKGIFLNANPSGVIDPDKPMYFPLTLDAAGVNSIDASNFGTSWQGADFIGVSWSNQQQDWTFVNLQKGKGYVFEITQKSVGGDFERSDAGEFSLRAMVHHEKGAATELVHVFPPPRNQMQNGIHGASRFGPNQTCNQFLCDMIT